MVLDQEGRARQVARLLQPFEPLEQLRTQGRRQVFVQEHDRVARRLGIGAVADGDVDALVLQVADLVHGIDADIDVGMLFREQREPRQQHQRGERGECRQGDPLAVLDAAQVGDGPVDIEQAGMDDAIQALACGRERQLSDAASKQRLADLVFQGLDLA